MQSNKSSVLYCVACELAGMACGKEAYRPLTQTYGGAGNVQLQEQVKKKKEEEEEEGETP